jgi:hypothetical protein
MDWFNQVNPFKTEFTSAGWKRGSQRFGAWERFGTLLLLWRWRGITWQGMQAAFEAEGDLWLIVSLQGNGDFSPILSMSSIRAATQVSFPRSSRWEFSLADISISPSCYPEQRSHLNQVPQQCELINGYVFNHHVCGNLLCSNGQLIQSLLRSFSWLASAWLWSPESRNHALCTTMLHARLDTMKSTQ